MRFCVEKNMTRRNQNLFFVEYNFKTCEKQTEKNLQNSLVVQWVGLGVFTARIPVQSLVSEN